MVKSAPSLGRIAAMVIFALSCFGLLLFLWLAFGGSVPLKPKGYRFKTSFAEAGQLSQEADVRISGVPVGKVKVIKADKVTVYSIQVNTDGDPESDVLKYCATSPENFFMLTSASQILSAFDQIAASLSKLRIAK